MNHSEHFGDENSADSYGKRFWRHASHPQNLGACAAKNASATGVGSCGDKIRVELHIADRVLQEVKCQPEGCVYTKACASAMSVLAVGRTIGQALSLQPEDVVNELEGLPEDHLHCARLAVNTLGDAIAEYYRRQFAVVKHGGSPSDTGQKE